MFKCARGPDRSSKRTLCAAMPTHGGEKVNEDVVASGSAAEFAVSGTLSSGPAGIGGQKRACLAPHGVCEEQGTGELAAGSQD
jgi:hypothetical protein